MWKDNSRAQQKIDSTIAKYALLNPETDFIFNSINYKPLFYFGE